MSDYEEDANDAGYETLDQWTARHIEEGREKWGLGNCFDWLNPGAHCFGCHYNHPQLTLAVTGLVIEARPKRLAPWCRALEAMKFKYQGNDTWRHATITPIEAVHGLLRKGVKRDHFDLVGVGFKEIKGWFEEQRISEELREELMNDPDAQVVVHPSGAVFARAGTDQATIDAALASVAAPAPAPAHSAGYESDGSEDSGDGILASDYEGPGANRRGNVGADSKDAFDDKAALALVVAAEEAAETEAADDVIDWDAVGDAADAARAEHDAKRARVL